MEGLLVSMGISLGLMIADKAVTLTSNTWDDLIITSARKVWGVTKGKFERCSKK